jgi:hypothetical protein
MNDEHFSLPIRTSVLEPSKLVFGKLTREKPQEKSRELQIANEAYISH